MEPTYFVVIQIVILIVQVFLAWLVFVRGRRQTSTYECDKLYMEITRATLEDDDLLDFYAVGTPAEIADWQAKSKAEKKLFLLAEMNYFHIAFVHREYRQGHVSEQYWQVYEKWLRKLLRTSAPFREVHATTADLFGGESDFAGLVNRIAREES